MEGGAGQTRGVVPAGMMGGWGARMGQMACK